MLAMRLVSARVRDYKSITDSGEVAVEEDVTCLVGKNESGKTAVLEALYRLNPIPAEHRRRVIRRVGGTETSSTRTGGRPPDRPHADDSRL